MVLTLQGKGPKRVGALYVTCQLFKVYFKVTLFIPVNNLIPLLFTNFFLFLFYFPLQIKLFYLMDILFWILLYFVTHIGNTIKG